MNPKILAAFAQWARSRGLKKPTDKEGLRVLFAQFLAQAQQQAQAAQSSDGEDEERGGAQWNEVPDDHPTHLTWDGASTHIVDARPHTTFKDDWDQLMEDRHAAKVGPDGSQLDDFDQEFQLQQKQQADLQAQAPYVRTNPSSILNGVSGSLVTPQLGGPPIQAAAWTGTDDETRVVTVTAAPAFGQTTLHGTTIKFRPFANVRFGTRAVLFPLQVDVACGVQLSLSASSVVVEIGLENTGNVNLSNIQFAGMISFGQIQKSSDITRTLYVDGIAAGGNAFLLNLPLFARNVTMWRDPVGEAITITFFDSNGNSVFEYALGANAIQTIPVQLPGDIGSITVADTGGAGVNFLRAIFGLSF